MITLEKQPSGTTFDIDLYQENGYFILRQAVDPKNVQELRDFLPMFNEKIKGQSGTVQDGLCHIQCERLNDGSSAIRKVHNDILQYPRMLELYTTPKVMQIVQEIIGDKIYIHHSKYMCKPANGGVRKPWHQDLAYWDERNRDGLKMVTVWTALDPSTKENGCIQVLPKSHRELLPHHQAEDFMIDESLINEADIVYAEMEPGDVLFFHVKVLHASAQNNSRKSRQSSIIDFSNQMSSEQNGSHVFQRNFAQ
jgi:ectoine hydroxylase-related dioxygenase (phytanoyl-CoA dioxygenase family)